MQETNLLVLDGSHVRVAVSELIAGDITVLDETVASVSQLFDGRIAVQMTNGYISVFKSLTDDTLVRAYR